MALDQLKAQRRGRSFDQHDLRPGHELRHHEAVQLRGVIQRQRGEHAVGGAMLAFDDAAHVLRHQRAVRHDGAFRRPGGAGGVAELGDVAVNHGLAHRTRCAARQRVGEQAGGGAGGVRCFA